MTFTLQILHTSDPEGRVDAVENAPNFAAIVDALETEQDNSITLSSGDNLIPGPFFYAAGNRAAFRDSGLFNSVYNTLFNLPADVDSDGTLDAYGSLREGGGRVDISILNIIGLDASTVGQHEFDLGSSAFASFIEADFQDAGLQDDRFVGTQFPYLSANLDFSEDVALADLFTDEILLNTAFESDPAASLADENIPKLAPATLIERSGEQIGVVGVSTPLLERVTSPTGTTVRNPGAGTEDMTALATVVQPTINDLRAGTDNILGTGDDINKIILLSHLQNLALDQELIGLLSGVDVVVAGGSGTLLADETDILRPGDIPAEQYPLTTTNADGEPALIVSANPEYSYVGRLVVTFDENGIIDLTALDESINGVIATTDQGVNAIAPDTNLFAPGTKAAEVQRLTDAVSDIFIAQDSQTFGQTEVFLEGRVQPIRTQETNLGNLAADADLAQAQVFDPTVQVSIKNAGGIRAPIGQVSDDGELLPPQENPTAGKSIGEVSQLDIESSLQFNNGLSLLTVTAAELEILVEHGVSATEPGALPGQFPQVGGLAFSFDPNQPAAEDLNGNQILDETEDQNGNGILDLGERVQSLAIIDPTDTVVDVIVRDGELVGDPNREIRLVTSSFLANGGDDYPFDQFGDNPLELSAVLSDEGNAQAAVPGTEQDAFAEFLATNFANTPFNMAETPIEADTRIQNLAFRTDTVLGEFLPLQGSDADEVLVAPDDRNSVILAAGGADTLAGGNGNDELLGEAGDDILRGDGNSRNPGNMIGGDDTLRGGVGNDHLGGKGGADLLFGDAGDDQLWGDDGDDTLNGGMGDDILTGDDFSGGSGNDIFVLAVGEGTDTIVDFEVSIDRIGLTEGLSLGSENFAQEGQNTLITYNGETLAILSGINATELTAASFTVV